MAGNTVEEDIWFRDSGGTQETDRTGCGAWTDWEWGGEDAGS